MPIGMLLLDLAYLAAVTFSLTFIVVPYTYPFFMKKSYIFLYRTEKIRYFNRYCGVFSGYYENCPKALGLYRKMQIPFFIQMLGFLISNSILLRSWMLAINS